ncbi:hypothetical protein Fmac_002886 [Flemingia macrophylla]|uniref:TFIIS N-terminal domain-containing protein n=1 Tax=Flemingia macrophylla TaxID=520843 RepID=A0ABD1NLU7_9FABA
MPNITIRTEISKILNDFPIDLEQYDRREQLKNSGLGKVIMFLSKSDEEIKVNRKVAQELVDKWSRPIFNKSSRFEDMRSMDLSLFLGILYYVCFFEGGWIIFAFSH